MKLSEYITETIKSFSPEFKEIRIDTYIDTEMNVTTEPLSCARIKFVLEKKI